MERPGIRHTKGRCQPERFIGRFVDRLLLLARFQNAAFLGPLKKSARILGPACSLPSKKKTSGERRGSPRQGGRTQKEGCHCDHCHGTPTARAGQRGPAGDPPIPWGGDNIRAQRHPALHLGRVAGGRFSEGKEHQFPKKPRGGGIGRPRKLSEDDQEKFQLGWFSGSLLTKKGFGPVEITRSKARAGKG